MINNMARIWAKGFELNSHDGIDSKPRKHKQNCKGKTIKGKTMTIISCTCYPMRIKKVGRNAETIVGGY